LPDTDPFQIQIQEHDPPVTAAHEVFVVGIAVHHSLHPVEPHVPPVGNQVGVHVVTVSRGPGRVPAHPDREKVPFGGL
jgi:hypothetical protein